MRADRKTFLTLGLLALLLLIPVLVTYAQDPTEEATPDAGDTTAEVTPEVTEDVGTAEATEDVTPGTPATGTATTVPLPSETPTSTVVATATPLPSATFTATFVPTLSGPPYVCDSTTIILLLLAQTYGFSQSQSAQDFNLADYDLGEAQAIFAMIQPVNASAVPVDTVLTDPAQSQGFFAFIEQFILEDVTILEDIAVFNEHPACFELRETLLEFLLLNVLYQQMQFQMGPTPSPTAQG